VSRGPLVFILCTLGLVGGYLLAAVDWRILVGVLAVLYTDNLSKKLWP
jgi:hypothetical protein